MCLFATALVPLCQQADAATWPVSVSQLSPSVSFHQKYTAGDNEYVHSGIDAPASAGLQIFSPVAGRVRFAGSVPSGDSRVGTKGSSETMLAVTVRMDDGRDITLMPFDTYTVEEGQSVAEGEVLGTLAASGDSSSTTSHIHMGLKQNGVYQDPMSLFGASSKNQPALKGDDAIEAAMDELPAAPTEYERLKAENAQSAADWNLEERTQLQGDVTTVPAEQEVGAITTGDVNWGDTSDTSADLSGNLAADLMGAVEGQAQAVIGAVEDMSRSLNVPIALVWALVAVLLAVAAGAMGIMMLHKARRAMVFDNAPKFFLRVRKGRGNMPKIFPASR